jgi:hypothetical protein
MVIFNGGLMTETHRLGAPLFVAIDEPPMAVAIDDDIYLTVTTAVPGFPGKVEAIDIILTVEYTRAVIAQLSTAVIASRRGEPRRSASLLFDRGRERDTEPRAIVGSPTVEAVQVGDCGDQCETEAGSRRALRLVGPVKTLKDRRHVPGRHTGTVVGDP